MISYVSTKISYSWYKDILLLCCISIKKMTKTTVCTTIPKSALSYILYNILILQTYNALCQHKGILVLVLWYVICKGIWYGPVLSAQCTVTGLFLDCSQSLDRPGPVAAHVVGVTRECSPGCYTPTTKFNMGRDRDLSGETEPILQKWGQHDVSRRARNTSVLCRRRPETPKGMKWRVVHETHMLPLLSCNALY